MSFNVHLCDIYGLISMDACVSYSQHFINNTCSCVATYQVNEYLKYLASYSMSHWKYSQFSLNNFCGIHHVITNYIIISTGSPLMLVTHWAHWISDHHLLMVIMNTNYISTWSPLNVAGIRTNSISIPFKQGSYGPVITFRIVCYRIAGILQGLKFLNISLNRIFRDLANFQSYALGHLYYNTNCIIASCSYQSRCRSKL